VRSDAEAAHSFPRFKLMTIRTEAVVAGAGRSSHLFHRYFFIATPASMREQQNRVR
jgi:hypothetical protein